MPPPDRLMDATRPPFTPPSRLMLTSEATRPSSNWAETTAGAGVPPRPISRPTGTPNDAVLGSRISCSTWSSERSSSVRLNPNVTTKYVAMTINTPPSRISRIFALVDNAISIDGDQEPQRVRRNAVDARFEMEMRTRGQAPGAGRSRHAAGITDDLAAFDERILTGDDP